MIHSMTGYGRAEGRYKGTAIVVDVRSVNHRHCEVVTRLPRVLQPHEDRFRNAVQGCVHRGRVEMTIAVNGDWSEGQGLRLDRGLARRYLALFKELQRELHVSGSPDLALLAGFRDIIKPAETPVDDRGAVRGVERLVSRALKALIEMRRGEGRVLARDLSGRLLDIERRLDNIRRRLPDLVQEQYARLQARLNRLLEAVPGGAPHIDPGRLAQEVALLADRGDVSEELTRLASHLQQFKGFLRKPGPVGRSLDFLVHEMNREVTTLNAKVADLTATQEILAVKAELEKVREQVQNVE